MITVLGGDMICALGDKHQRRKHLESGTFKTVSKQVDVFGEAFSYPYYEIAHDIVLQELFDPVPIVVPLVQRLVDEYSLDSDSLGRCGLFLGCSANDLSIASSLLPDNEESSESPFEGQRVGNGLYAARLVEHFSMNGLSLTYNTACTSSANAVIDASSMLEAGLIDYALIVGLEMFSSLSFKGFTSMQLLADDQASPFDRNRQGMVLGESIAVLLMSRDDVSQGDWLYRGGVNRSEVDSVTGARTDGSGIKEVIELVLGQCDLKAEEITAIKTHGVGTYIGDLAEMSGMKQIFREQPDLFSFKPYIGHTLGSCGVSELLLLTECVDQGFIPMTPNFHDIDPLLQWAPTRTRVGCQGGLFLLNYFGFGGNNVSMVLEKVAR